MTAFFLGSAAWFAKNATWRGWPLFLLQNWNMSMSMTDPWDLRIQTSKLPVFFPIKNGCQSIFFPQDLPGQIDPHIWAMAEEGIGSRRAERHNTTRSVFFNFLILWVFLRLMLGWSIRSDMSIVSFPSLACKGRALTLLQNSRMNVGKYRKRAARITNQFSFVK